MSPAPTGTSTLSLHDALPISAPQDHLPGKARSAKVPPSRYRPGYVRRRPGCAAGNDGKSEEHTSELQSRRDLVCRLLLEKKKIRSSASGSAAALTVAPGAVRE